MITSVYLSNNHINAIIGSPGAKKVKISRIYQGEIQEGSLINGMVINKDELKEQLGDFWRMNNLPKRNVSLVINSSQFVIKPLSLPRMNRNNVMEIISKEFSDVERSNRPIYDYMILNENGSSKNIEVLANMVAADFVESFVQIFAEIGVKIISVNTALGCGTKLLNILPKLKGKTFIAQILDDSNLTSILWVNGTYTYSTRSRLFSESGTDEFGVEVARNVSSITQFHASLKSGSAIERVYFGGMTAEDMESCNRGLQVLNLEGSVIPCEGAAVALDTLDGALENNIYTVGNLVTLSKDINLYKSAKKSPKKEEDRQKFLLGILPAILVLGVCAVSSSVLMISNINKEKELEELESYLNDSTNIENQNQSMALEAEIARISNQIVSADSTWKALESYPKMNSTVENAVIACGQGIVTVEIQGYDTKSGALTLNATTSGSQVNEGNAFIDRLNESGLFNNVEYSGYSLLENANRYNLNVVGYLAESAGR